MENHPHPDTPAKSKRAVDGYQTRGVAGLPGVPAMSEPRITNPSARGAEDITRTPVGGTVYDDAG
jgi:hypothetical protein